MRYLSAQVLTLAESIMNGLFSLRTGGNSCGLTIFICYPSAQMPILAESIMISMLTLRLGADSGGVSIAAGRSSLRHAPVLHDPGPVKQFRNLSTQ